MSNHDISDGLDEKIVLTLNLLHVTVNDGVAHENFFNIGEDNGELILLHKILHGRVEKLPLCQTFGTQWRS